MPTAQSNPILSFLPLIVMFVVFYFLLIRPQQKQQKALQATVQNLKKGDKIVTSGGIIGIIAGIQDDYVVIKVGDSDTKLEILKSAISGKRE
ncbi:MAG: preprotein translocase subunit YajC [Candidatus Omnitrophica bacterium]|nr:preprotein translocase subunit YajC [Candidatus Omnitrophota bacterium]